MDFSSRQVECFLETAELLNFTAVSEKMYLSQSAVSKQIRNLEKEFDFPSLKLPTPFGVMNLDKSIL